MNTSIDKGRYLGTFMGLAMGDALGARHEGGPLEKTVWFFLGLMKPGVRCYTDDTQMALNIADSFLENDGIDQDHLAREFGNSYRWSRGYGAGAAKLLSAIKKGGDWRKLNKAQFPDGSYGNGAAMRAPILALCFSDSEEMCQAVEQCAEITHPNALAVEGATLISLATHAALSDVDTTDIISNLLSQCENEVYRKKLHTCSTLLQASEPADVGIIREQLGNGVAACDSTVTAIYLALRFRELSFASMIETITELGGDVDTIGAMAGAIWGALNGAASLDQTILKSIEDADRIADIAERLFDKRRHN